MQHERLQAINHPCRVAIIVALGNEKASPTQIQRKLKSAGYEWSLGTISYHFHILLDAKMLRLVDSRSRRGAIEHFYRANPKTHELIKVLSKL